MSSDDDVFTGEYFVSLKNYKIPRKPPKKKSQFDMNNPPPPGTEDEISIKKEHSNVSPLALKKQPAQLKFEAATPSPPPPPSLNDTIQVNKNTTQTDTPTKTLKRSSLFMMPSAEGLPEELIKLFKPLCCDLCSAKLNSPATARLHYESKNHEKKINNWLATWSERTGEPLPKRQATQKGPTGPNALHCDICDIALTSLQHAKQHNMGRKHKNALAGKSKPSGSGYYDANNKWIRTSTEEDSTGRFRIGEAFLVQKDSNVETMIVPESVLNEPPPPPPPLETFPKTDNEVKTVTESFSSFEMSPDDLIDSLLESSSAKKPNEIAQMKIAAVAAIDLGKYCKICDISVTSEMHMRLHLSGAKHTKKLRHLGEPPYTIDAPPTLSQCVSDEVTMKRPKPTNPSDCGQTLDYSVFRTPSGQYYCQVCDLSVTSEVTLSQHFASKRHIKMVKKK